MLSCIALKNIFLVWLERCPRLSRIRLRPASILHGTDALTLRASQQHSIACKTRHSHGGAWPKVSKKRYAPLCALWATMSTPWFLILTSNKSEREQMELLTNGVQNVRVGEVAHEQGIFRSPRRIAVLCAPGGRLC